MLALKLESKEAAERSLGAGGRRRRPAMGRRAYCAALQLADESEIDVHGALGAGSPLQTRRERKRVGAVPLASPQGLLSIRAQSTIAAMRVRCAKIAAHRMHGRLLRLLLRRAAKLAEGIGGRSIQPILICCQQSGASLQQLRSRGRGSRPGAGFHASSALPARESRHDAGLGAAAVWVGVCMVLTKHAPCWRASLAFGSLLQPPPMRTQTDVRGIAARGLPAPAAAAPACPTAAAQPAPHALPFVNRLCAMASAYTLCRGNVAGVASIGKGRLLVSVQGDGVSCYDTADRVRAAR